MNSARRNIESLTPYTPGEQPGARSVIKLNTNENPYPPTDAVVRTIREVPAEALRKYPSPTAAAFRDAAAKVHDLDPSQVIATNGGDELLRMLVTAYCEPGGDRGGIGLADPTYSLYEVLAAIHDTPVTRVPLEADYAVPGDFTKQLNDAGCRLAMLVSPHAPSGRQQSVDDLRQVARSFEGVLVVDEAYVDFADRDATDLVRGSDAEPNVMLLRSLSKGYSLAGLRFGYGMGAAEIVETLDKVRDSYNTDAVAQAAAMAAMLSRSEASQSWQKVIADRAMMTDALTQRGFEVVPSQSNFLLATVPNAGPNAEQIYRSLKDRGIFVRFFNQPRLVDKLRITIGTPEQNRALLDALDHVLDEGG